MPQRDSTLVSLYMVSELHTGCVHLPICSQVSPRAWVLHSAIETAMRLKVASVEV